MITAVCDGGRAEGGVQWASVASSRAASAPLKTTPFVPLFIGPTGHPFGFKDGWTDERVFEYTGRGLAGRCCAVASNLQSCSSHSHLHDFQLLSEHGGEQGRFPIEISLLNGIEEVPLVGGGNRKAADGARLL